MIKYGNASSKTFLRVYDGQLTEDKGQKQPIDEEGKLITWAKQRPHKTKGNIWYLPIQSIQGYITDIYKKDSVIPSLDIEISSLVIEIKDKTDGTNVQIDMIWGSTPANSIMYRLPNIDTSKHSKIWATKFNEKDYLTVAQENEDGEYKIPLSPYPKGEDSPVPPLEKKKIRGKMVWDDTERLEWFVEQLEMWQKNNKPITLAQQVKEKATKPHTEVDSGDPALEKLLDGLDTDDVKSKETGIPTLKRKTKKS